MSTTTTITPTSTELIGKSEIGIDEFLMKYRKYDGRSVIVGIFDTGVDPGADGLRSCADGSVKIVDCVDCTGSGDVDTSLIRSRSNDDGCVENVYGDRRLYIPDTWSCPSGEFFVGVKRAYDLFPRRLEPRIRELRRKEFDERNRQLMLSLKRELSECDSDDTNAQRDTQLRIDALTALTEKYNDVGPMYDVVCFHDGENWRVAINTSDDEPDLTTHPLLTDYRIEHQYGVITEHQTMMNYTVNVYDNGRCVSIVVPAGSHGTHVAGIVGAYYGDAGSNGVAPNVRLVSVKIGDSRLGSMETGTGLVRGLIAAKRAQCDIINMSYGEATAECNVGRFPQLLEEFVTEHGIIFVSSAGNAGPALSTAGAPGATTAASIGVGAYVSPNMMTSCYTMIDDEQLQAMPYSWSSRGPSADGALGVCVVSCGGAIAPVPEFTLKKNQLMNGTSMSSPHCCAAIALLVSGCKQESIPYTPYFVRKALENTAAPVHNSEPFSVGHGLVQVGAAFSWMQNMSSSQLYTPFSLPYHVEVRPTHKTNARYRGVYVREPYEVNTITEWITRVRPVFNDDMPAADKLQYECRLELVASHKWISCPSSFYINNDTRDFKIVVNPKSLSHGVECGGVQGLVDGHVVFTIPVTVVVPEKTVCDHRYTHLDQHFSGHGETLRRFYTVPHGATWVDVKLTGRRLDGDRKFMVHLLYLRDRMAHCDKEQLYLVRNNEQVCMSMAVVGNVTLEVCLAQYWSSIGASSLDVEVVFRGINPEKPTLCVTNGVTRVDLTSYINEEKCLPVGSFDTVTRHIRPSKLGTISAPTDLCRDELPHARIIYSLLNVYTFEVGESVTVTPKLPGICERLYECEFEGQMWMIFDSHKRMIKCGDAFKYSVQLSKGKYTMRVLLRHDSLPLLNKFRDMLVMLNIKLPKKVDLKFYTSYNAALKGESPMKREHRLQRLQSTVVYTRPPLSTSEFKIAKLGDTLQGTVHYCKEQNGRRPNGFIVQYVVCPAQSPTPPVVYGPSPPPVVRTVEVIRRDNAKKLLVDMCDADCVSKEEFQKYADDVLQNYARDLEVLVQYLCCCEKKKDPVMILSASNRVLDVTKDEVPTLITYFGSLHTSPEKLTGEARGTYNKHDATRKHIIQALRAKGQALATRIQQHMFAPESENSDEHDGDPIAFAHVLEELGQWVDVEQELDIFVTQQLLAGRFGGALVQLHTKLCADPNNPKATEWRRLIMKIVDCKLGPAWLHWKTLMALDVQYTEPRDYAPL